MANWLAQRRALPAPALDSVPLKEAKDFTLIGTPPRRGRQRQSARGRAVVRHRHAPAGPALCRARNHAGAWRRAEICRYTAAAAATGVVAVLPLAVTGTANDSVAVVATNYWYAEQARKLLKLEWDLAPAQGHSQQRLCGAGQSAARCRRRQRHPPRRRCPGQAGIGGKAHRGALFLSLPRPCADGAAELHGAFQDGKLEIWTPCQNPQSGVDQIAKQLGIPAADQTVHITRMGGGFGRRLVGDYTLQAAAIAKALPGRPIQLIYSREEDFRRDIFRPGGWHGLKAGLDAQGKLIALSDHFATFTFEANRPVRRRWARTSSPPGCWRTCSTPRARCRRRSPPARSARRNRMRSVSSCRASSMKSPRLRARTCPR